MRVQTESEFSLKNLSTSQVFKSKLIENLPTKVVEREDHDTGRIKKAEIIVDVLKHTSAQSPIGMKIRNKEIGDKFEILVDGHKIRYEIIEIS